MLLSFNHHHHHHSHHRIFPSSPLIPYSSPVLFPIAKTQIFSSCSIHLNDQTPSSKSLARSSSIHHQEHRKTLPQSAIQRIAEKLRSLGFTENPKSNSPETETKSAGEIFIPLPNQLPKYRVGHTLDPSWSTPENPVPVPGTGDAILKYHDLRKEVKREREAKKAEGRVPWLAELSLGKDELRRLRRIGIAEKKKLKVGKAGITEGIVNGIHERWRRAEVVKIVCEDLCKMNMKRTHDLLERKTGGLVVWRAGSKIVLYRGVNYKYPYFLAENSSVNETSWDEEPNMDAGRIDEVGSSVDVVDGVESSGPGLTNKIVQRNLVQGVGSPNRVRFQLPGEAQLTEEVDRWLDGLGPRFTDWWGYDPLPVDADLLPAVIPGYRRPFRLLPYGIKSTLTNDEMTTLKRLGRPLPCHFALGRNRKLQGLAASIVKLWEKCEIAKIAIKRGVQNTNSELMAEELKFLTGGTLLSRDREFIVLYRGKDFLPSAVSSAIQDRRKPGIQWVRQHRDCTKEHKTVEELKDGTIDVGTRGESDAVNDRKHDLSDNRKLRSTDNNRKLRSAEAAISKTTIKLSMALEKKAKAEKLLAELEKSEMPHMPEIDKEGITEEERYMLRKVGLKMKPFLLMGRRGLFDGTIENMHLHWKYRELVKIICKERGFEAVQEVARTLEAESGGILVAVESVSKGYAIIVYRGKNYKRPACLRPSTLLSKRQAMKRSLEAQRRESLKLNVLRLTKNVDHLKHQLVKDKEAHNLQSSDGSRFQVKERSNNVELAGPTISDSELKSNSHSYTTFPAHPEEIIEVKEELTNVELAGPTASDSELKSNCHYYTAFPVHPEEIIENTDKYETDSTAVNLNNDDVDASVKSTELVEQSYWTDLSSTFDVNETGENGLNSSFESVRTETCESLVTSISGDVNPISCLNNSMPNNRNISPLINPNRCVSMNGEMGSLVESTKNELQTSVPSMVEEDNQMPSNVVCLSNRDRLLLRKQALKMKKRPVLAVGRSNIVTGVAKAIKAHFQRHPLAIVNVKARAKGTSVQEVVSKLEEATGGVLVSQEPSKVILYRGWGAGDEAGHKGKKNAQDAGKASSEEGRVRHAVSPELMAAIRLECGLRQNQSKRSTQSVEI